VLLPRQSRKKPLHKKFKDMGRGQPLAAVCMITSTSDWRMAAPVDAEGKLSKNVHRPMET
jgi:hypothetical protein